MLTVQSSQHLQYEEDSDSQYLILCVQAAGTPAC